MVGTVGHVGTQNLRLPIHASFMCFALLFHDKPHSTAAEYCTVPVAVKGFSCFRYPFFYSSGTDSEKTRPDPLILGRRSGIVTTDDNNTFAASHSDPVLGNADGQGGGGTGTAHQRIGALGPDDLGQVPGTQRAGIHHKSSVKLVRSKIIFFAFSDIEKPVSDRLLDLGILNIFHEIVI